MQSITAIYPIRIQQFFEKKNKLKTIEIKCKDLHQTVHPYVH